MTNILRNYYMLGLKHILFKPYEVGTIGKLVFISYMSKLRHREIKYLFKVI